MWSSRRALRAFERLSLALWGGALVLGTWAFAALPHWRGGPFPQGCYLRDALIFSVECRDTWADGLFGFVLTLAISWTWQGPFVMAMAAATIVGLPLALLWAGSLVCAVLPLARLARRGIRSLLA